LRQPSLYIPHGGGPCFFMEWTYGPKDTWARMGEMLRGLPALLPARPAALLVVSAHWEADVPTVQTAPHPSLYFDYHGFPPHTYELSWPAPGAPEVARRVGELLSAAGIASDEDDERGFDHGVFVPLLLAFPAADVPTLQLSLRRGLGAGEHLAIGAALAPLRDEGVVIVGSGMSYHNLGGVGARRAREASRRFDDWLGEAVNDPDTLKRWESAPEAAVCHPRSEHLTPLFVAAGAGGRGERFYRDEVLGATVSAFRFV
jgi:aromatic ring-opening dioxygenase catalytic subunit (LigB family)